MATNPFEFVVRSLAESHPGDAAHALEALATPAAVRVVSRLPRATAGRVLERLAPTSAAAILSELGVEAARALLAGLPPRQAASILSNFDEAVRGRTLAGMGEAEVQRLGDLLEYPPETAGGMMEVRVASVRTGRTVREAVQALRRTPRSTLWYLYVTDAEGRLMGVVNTRDLLLAESRQTVDELAQRELVTVTATALRDQLEVLFREHRFVAVPVVDADGRLLGILKREDVLAGLREEAFVDLQKMVGAGEEEKALSPVSLVVRKRLPWLYVNLATAFLAASVVGFFEGTIERVTALAVLLPVVAGQGGNTGAQALAVVMRGLALREIAPGAERRVLTKEALGGLLNGVLVAVGTALAVWAWDGRAALALVMLFAMIVNMAAAGLFGAAIPIVLAARGQDPAQSSSILLTTVTDCVGFAAFLGFAAAFMPWIAG